MTTFITQITTNTNIDTRRDLIVETTERTRNQPSTIARKLITLHNSHRTKMVIRRRRKRNLVRTKVKRDKSLVRKTLNNQRVINPLDRVVSILVMT